MQAQIDIGYDQLVELVRQLPKKQWNKLKSDIEEQGDQTDHSSEMVSFLLSAPTFNQKQLDEIANARKEISKWRTK